MWFGTCEDYEINSVAWTCETIRRMRFARRTLERQRRDLKAKHGPAQEIIFRQKHEPGRRGAWGQHCGGAAVAHKLHHSRLEYAGFCYAAVVVGGEGLQSAARGTAGGAGGLGGAVRRRCWGTTGWRGAGTAGAGLKRIGWIEGAHGPGP